MLKKLYLDCNVKMHVPLVLLFIYLFTKNVPLVVTCDIHIWYFDCVKLIALTSILIFC